MPEQRMRAILAQRPGLGEMQVHKIPAWVRYQKGPTHLPAQTQTTKVGIIPASLPSRDVVQKQGQNSYPSIEFLPSRDGAQPTPARLPRPTPPKPKQCGEGRGRGSTRHGRGCGPVVTGKTAVHASHSPCARHRRAARIKDCWHCSRNRWRALPATLGFRTPAGRGRASHL